MSLIKKQRNGTKNSNHLGKIKKGKGNKIMKTTPPKLNYKLKQMMKVKYKNEQNKYINSVGIVSRIYNVNNKNYYLIIDL